MATNQKDLLDFKRRLEGDYKKQYSERSKERLIKSLERKFRTTFIGALSSFEDFFKEEWGGSKDINSLSEEQYRKRELWEQVRTVILNNGNNQLRAAKNEIEEYTIEWNKHETILLPRND